MVPKVNAIDTKIPSARSWKEDWRCWKNDSTTSGLVKKTDYNTKITEYLMLLVKLLLLHSIQKLQRLETKYLIATGFKSTTT